jgi:hypothetical protein
LKLKTSVSRWKVRPTFQVTPLSTTAVADTQAVEHLQRALGVADAARADADGVVLVEQHDGQAALRRVDGRRQAHRAGADDHQRHARGLARRAPAAFGTRSGARCRC